MAPTAAALFGRAGITQTGGDNSPGNTRDTNGFFFATAATIFAVPDSSGYGDKRGRNKPFGPGGSTRRLHQMPPRRIKAPAGMQDKAADLRGGI